MTVDKKRTRKKIRYRIFKRVLDIIFSSLLLFFLFLPMILIGISIRLTSKGSAIFKQERVGKDGNIFICLKFRTMRISAPKDRPTSSFSDAEKYVTPIGRLLRKSSMDELPQLWNVLMGDMSLVGPRPLIPNEGNIHSLRSRCGVYNIRPGITGLAQISGRDMLGDLEKVRLDTRYVKMMSLSTDIAIIFKTLFKTIIGEDIIIKGMNHTD